MAPSATSPIASPSPISTDPTILALRKTLTNESESLAKRFRALFSLKHVACQTREGKEEQQKAEDAIEAIAAGFVTDSSLLGHELAYVLGQTKNVAAIPYLRERLLDLKEDPIVRHEAAEALGAIGDLSSLELLKDLRTSDAELIVRETCEIAVDRLVWENSEEGKREILKASDFTSIDPAPPMEHTKDITALEKTLLDTDLPLFKRYRALFTLRDLASPPDLPTAVPAVLAMAKGLKDPSALFRHEVAFTFGQLSHPASIPALTESLADVTEAPMVRHESAEALGSLGDEAGVEDTLKRFLHDSERVVRESVIVALDMAEFERGGELEYALIPEVAVA